MTITALQKLKPYGDNDNDNTVDVKIDDEHSSCNKERIAEYSQVNIFPTF